MAKRINRKLKPAGESQRDTEKNIEDKFAKTETLAQSKPQIQPVLPVRISPQLSCTITQEDMDFLQQLTLEMSVKTGRILKISQTVRSLIAYGKLHKDNVTVIE
jgi:hypothetical protein